MKALVMFALLTTLPFVTYGQETKNAAPSTATKEQVRAKAGQDVWIVVTYVQDAARPEFEKWVKEVFYPALQKSANPMHQDQLNNTRWLEPASQNEDKSWTYVWIMDPVVPKADYDIPTMLNAAYGEEKGKAHWEKYQTFFVKAPEIHILKQTGY